VIDFRFGSKPDLQRHLHFRPLLGVKQTSNVRFLSPRRSCADDVRLRGKSGLSGVTLRMSACSHKRTFEDAKFATRK